MCGRCFEAAINLVGSCMDILQSSCIHHRALRIIQILYESVLLPLLDSPVAAFTWIVLGPLDFDELLVEGQAVPDAVLPTAFCETIKCKVVRDPFIDLRKREAALLRPEYSHANQCSIAVSWPRSLNRVWWHVC
jgi:hypothetical protein